MFWPFIKKYDRDKVRVEGGYAIKNIVIGQSPIEQSPYHINSQSIYYWEEKAKV